MNGAHADMASRICVDRFRRFGISLGSATAETMAMEAKEDKQMHTDQHRYAQMVCGQELAVRTLAMSAADETAPCFLCESEGICVYLCFTLPG
jgi:hypothetical protein